MKLSILIIIAIICFMSGPSVTVAQARRSAGTRKTTSVQKPREIGATAVVMDETLSVLRTKPSLFSNAVQRMRRGRVVKILGIAEADGIRFYKISAAPKNYGWVQADAVFGKFREADEERLVRLARAADGFDQIELASAFFELYPASRFRPSLLLLFGDLLEDTAQKLSKDAVSRLNRGEMAASAAPMHSYFLNFVGLDRYRKLGILFLFNSKTRTFHYDGASWQEIIKAYPASTEAAEAQKRLDSLKLKMEKQ